MSEVEDFYKVFKALRNVIGIIVIIISILYTSYSAIFERFAIPSRIEKTEKKLVIMNDRNLDLQYNLEKFLKKQDIEWEQAPEYWKKLRSQNF